MYSIGNKIRKIRELRGFSQEYVAGKLHISQKQLSLLELDKIKVDLRRIEDISTILEVDPMFLLSFDENQIFNNCKQSGNFFYSNVYGNDISPDKLKDEIINVLKDEITILKKIIDLENK